MLYGLLVSTAPPVGRPVVRQHWRKRLIGAMLGVTKRVMQRRGD
jgi:hypothetical protein